MMCRAGQATYYNTAHAHYMLDEKKNHNSCPWLPTVKMVTRTCLNFTLRIHRLCSQQVLRNWRPHSCGYVPTWIVVEMYWYFLVNYCPHLCSRQIPGATPRQETYLESPHLYTTETPGPQDQRTILDHRQTLSTIAEQQTVNLQGGSNMTGTDLYVNKPHCAAAVRPWQSEATTSTLPPARVRTCSVLSGSC